MKIPIHRSKDKVVAGVLGGFAEYLNWNAAPLRILWIFLTFSGGLGVILYLLGWVLMEDPE